MMFCSFKLFIKQFDGYFVCTILDHFTCCIFHTDNLSWKINTHCKLSATLAAVLEILNGKD